MSGPKPADDALPEAACDADTAERAFRVLFDHGPVGLAALTVDGRIFAANPALQQLLGISELRGLVVDDVVPPEELARLTAILARVSGGETRTEVGPVVTRGGVRITVRATVMPVRTPAGEPSFSLAVVEPIDEQLRLQEDLDRARAAAHDLNNLLMPLLYYAERLYERLTGNSSAQQGAEQVRELARKVFERARTSLRAADAQSAGAVDVNGTLLALGSIARLLLGPDIDIVLKPDLSRPLVRVDRVGLERALENIAVNARDAMPDGGTFTVETEQREDTVVIRCSDTGTGIAPEARDHLFEPTFTTKGAGHGLGLKSVRAFVESCGGAVTVESDPGTATNFTLTLPRADDSGADGRSTNSDPTPAGS